jgi:hypothetical protein
MWDGPEGIIVVCGLRLEMIKSIEMNIKEDSEKADGLSEIKHERRRSWRSLSQNSQEPNDNPFEPYRSRSASRDHLNGRGSSRMWAETGDRPSQIVINERSLAAKMRCQSVIIFIILLFLMLVILFIVMIILVHLVIWISLVDVVLNFYMNIQSCNYSFGGLYTNNVSSFIHSRTRSLSPSHKTSYSPPVNLRAESNVQSCSRDVSCYNTILVSTESDLSDVVTESLIDAPKISTSLNPVCVAIDNCSFSVTEPC